MSRLKAFLFGDRNYFAVRQDLIVSVKAEITDRLKKSLHYSIREQPQAVKLPMELQPHKVRRFWDKEALSQAKSEIVPLDMSITDVFNSDEVGGRLLVLGEPGSGKTTMLLEIAYQLVKISAENVESPIPVLLNLSSWKDSNQSIIDWINVELRKYRLSKTISKTLIGNRKLIPLLDGLDEVEPKLQSLCIRALNDFSVGDFSPPYLVICCGYQQYNNTEEFLSLNNAVYLKKLTRRQVKNYLDVKQPELWNFLKNDPYSVDLICNPFLLNVAILSCSNDSIKKWQEINDTANKHCQKLLKAYIQDLLQLSKTPYLLKILTLSYQETSLKNLPGLVLADARISYLLNSYIEETLRPIEKDNELYTEKVPTSEQTKKWLVWIAQKLELELDHDFLVENLQPYWLFPHLGGSKAELRDYLIACNWSYITAVQFGPFLHAVISTPNVYIKVGNIHVWYPLSVAFPFFIAIILGTKFTLRTIKTVDLVDFPILKIIVLLFLLLLLIPQSVLGSTERVALVYLFSGLLFFNLRKVEEDKKKRKVVNEGILKSAVNATGFGFFYGFIIFIGLWSTYNFYPLGVIDAFFAGLSQGIFVALITGGDAVIRHFALRFSLSRHGRIPWKYKSFLNFARRRRLLQRVGGRYRFIHPLLKEHFARLEI